MSSVPDLLRAGISPILIPYKISENLRLLLNVKYVKGESHKSIVIFEQVFHLEG